MTRAARGPSATGGGTCAAPLRGTVLTATADPPAPNKESGAPAARLRGGGPLHVEHNPADPQLTFSPGQRSDLRLPCDPGHCP